MLEIPDGVTQTVLLPVAYMKGAVLKPAQRKRAGEVTFWDSWGTIRDGGPAASLREGVGAETSSRTGSPPRSRKWLASPVQEWVVC